MFITVNMLFYFFSRTVGISVEIGHGRNRRVEVYQVGEKQANFRLIRLFPRGNIMSPFRQWEPDSKTYLQGQRRANRR